MTPNEACQISPNLYEANNLEVLRQVVTGHCQQHGLRDLKVCRCIAFHSQIRRKDSESFFGQRAALAEEHLGRDLQEFGRLHSVCTVIQSNFRRISADQENTHDQARASLN
jgi:hypothetical protein